MKALLSISALVLLAALTIPAYADTDFSMFRNADGPHEGHTYRAFDHYEDGTANTEVGYSYVGGIYDIKDFVITGFFTDINGTAGATITQTKALVTPDEVFSLFFENPIPGDVSRFDYSIIGGQLVLPEPEPVFVTIDKGVSTVTDTTVTLTGTSNSDVTIIVKSANGNVVAIEQATTHPGQDRWSIAIDYTSFPHTGDYTFEANTPSAVSDEVTVFLKVSEPTPQPPTNSTSPAKMTVCHNGNELSIPEKAVRKHVAHGDAVGNCPIEEPMPEPTPQTETEVYMEIPQSIPTQQTTNWEQKYFDIVSKLNTTADKLGQVEQQNKDLKEKIDNLNALVMEQVKVIYKWVLNK